MIFHPPDFSGPKHFSRALVQLEHRFSGTKARPPYDYVGLVERFSRGAELSLRDQGKLPYALIEGTPPLLDRPALPRALAEMSQQLESGRSRPLEGAIYCLLQVPPGKSSGLPSLLRWVNENLPRHGPQHRLLEHWTRHASLFGPSGPRELAELMLRAPSFSEGLKQSRVPPQCWLVEEALPSLGRWTAVEWHHKRSEFYQFLEGDHRHAIPRMVDATLSRLLDPTASRQRVPEIEAFFLKHLGHPSMDRRGLWQTVSDPARALARRWLNEKNVKLFYEHLVRSGDSHRLQFWLQFLDDGVDDVRIAVGPYDSDRSNEEIRKAIREGEIASLDGGPGNVSAVFLKLRSVDWWIVEFSQVGNATYAYRSHHKKPDFWWGQRRFRLGELKQGGSGWPYRIIHPSSYLHGHKWQEEYAEKLRNTLHGEFPPRRNRAWT